jgi:hypothetical protein
MNCSICKKKGGNPVALYPKGWDVIGYRVDTIYNGVVGNHQSYIFVCPKCIKKKKHEKYIVENKHMEWKVKKGKLILVKRKRRTK